MDGSIQPVTIITGLLPLASIRRDEKQMRKVFNEEKLKELAESLRQTNGCVQPIVVRTWIAKAGEQLDVETHQYELIAGERRWRASALAGFTHIAATVRDDLSELDGALLQLVENLQRVDLETMELAAGCQQLITIFEQQIAKGEVAGTKTALELAANRMGKSTGWVSKHTSLLESSKEIRQLVETGKVVGADTALDLEKIIEIDPKRGDALLREFADAGKNEYSRMPTREIVRRNLKEAKEDAKQKAQNKLEQEAKRKDPKAIAVKQKEKDAAAKEKADRQRNEAFDKEAKQHSTALENRLMLLMGIPAGAQASGGYYRPVSVSSESYGGYFNKAAPKDLDSAKFHVRFSLDAKHLQVAVGALGFVPEIDIRNIPKKITVEQAHQITEILGNEVCFAFSAERTGKQVEGISVRLAHANLGKTPPTKEPQPFSVDHLRAFIKAKAERSKENWILARDFHAAFITWCEENSIVSIPLNSNIWGSSIEEVGIEKKRTGNGYRYSGISLSGLSN